MPIYEYRCDACGAELEKLQKMNEPRLEECPECGRHALSRLVSASSFRLKGSGWYETDFKTGKKKNGAADGSGTASAEGSAVASPAETPSSGTGSASSDAGKGQAA